MNTGNNWTPSADADPRRYDEAIRSGQEAAHRAVDQMADGAGRMAERAGQWTQRGTQALREQGQHLRDGARHMTDSTIVHIRHAPLKSVLIAAAIGAVLGMLLSMSGRSRY